MCGTIPKACRKGRQCVKVAIVVLSLIWSLSVVAAEIQEIALGRACSYFGEQITGSVHTFDSNQQAEQFIEDIVSSSGLSGRFNVRAAGVPNAAAVIRGEQRFILYSTGFIRSIRRATDSDWGSKSILAHEIGHHLNGHTLAQGGSRPNIELEADYFSGFVLQKMDASLEDAQVAMATLGSERGSATHPPKRDRLEAIASGWTKACNQDRSCNDSGRVVTQRDLPPPVAPGPDSCEYAADGECDEPGLCPTGTDTTDCHWSRRRPDIDPIIARPPATFASYCITSAGSCQMMVPIAVGSVCTCYTPYGAFAGRAQ